MASIVRRETVRWIDSDGGSQAETFRVSVAQRRDGPSPAELCRAEHPGSKVETAYDVRWRLPDGSTKTKTFTRRADADSWKRQVEHDELRGVVTDRRHERMTVADLGARWLKSRPSKRARSLELDTDILRLHVEPTLGAMPIRAVTRADNQTLVSTWSATGLAASTVARQYSALRAMFSYAENADLIVKSPCRSIQLPQVRPPARPHLDRRQLQRLAKALGSEHAPMMWLAAVLGLRWSEAAGLRSSDIDFDAGTVAVTAQLGRDGSLAAPKSVAGIRRMAAPAWLLDELKAHLEAFPPASDGLVFRKSVAGTPLSYSPWHRLVWKPATKAAGLERLRFHDLRSLAATALVAAGVDLKTAQTRLGHSSPHLTLAVYARATEEADRAAARAIGDLFRPRDVRAKSGVRKKARREAS